MAHFQIPRYVAFIDAFPKTPTERVEKYKLAEEGAERPGVLDADAARRPA